MFIIMNKIISQIKTFIKETDKFLLFLSVLISVFGILLVSSATRTGEEMISRDARVMIIAVSVGVIMSLIISVIDYNFIIRLWPVIAGVCIFLMLLLFIPGVGVGPPSRPDVKTWIVLGSSGLYFQPSELVKISFTLIYAAFLSQREETLRSLKGIIIAGLFAAPFIGLVLAGSSL